MGTIEGVPYTQPNTYFNTILMILSWLKNDVRWVFLHSDRFSVNFDDVRFIHNAISIILRVQCFANALIIATNISILVYTERVYVFESMFWINMSIKCSTMAARTYGKTIQCPCELWRWISGCNTFQGNCRSRLKRLFRKPVQQFRRCICMEWNTKEVWKFTFMIIYLYIRI